MATTKKKSSGRKKSTSAKSTMTKRKKIGTKTYTRTACGLNKTDAKKKADAARKKKRLARVLKNEKGKKGYCVYTAARKKSA